MVLAHRPVGNAVQAARHALEPALTDQPAELLTVNAGPSDLARRQRAASARHLKEPLAISL